MSLPLSLPPPRGGRAAHTLRDRLRDRAREGEERREEDGMQRQKTEEQKVRAIARLSVPPLYLRAAETWLQGPVYLG